MSCKALSTKLQIDKNRPQYFMADIIADFQEYIHRHCGVEINDTLLLAVSGGLDSVVLCELCHRCGYNFAIAHCNFQLRGEESERDETFVRSLAARYNKQVFVKQFDTTAYTAQHKVSIQVAARELRYQWFYSIMETQKTDKGMPLFAKIVTAHHADDNAETVLMNFFKGTGITGLRGILPKQDKLVRPLLFASRKQITSFAGEHNLQFVEDSSNSSLKYTRNYVRHQLIPVIEKIFPAVRENIQDNIERLRDVELLYRQSIDNHRKKLLEYRGGEVFIPVQKLKKVSPLKTIVFEIVREWNFLPGQLPDIMALLDGETGKYIQSATHRIVKNREWLIIGEKKSDIKTITVIEQPSENIRFAGGELSVKERTLDGKDWKPGTDPYIAEIDADDIKFPLLLRNWKDGDYFYPLGMQKKKKLSRFFIDQKLSQLQKEQVWVLECNKKIIWVVGRRIDNRFRVTASTKKLLQIKLNAL